MRHRSLISVGLVAGLVAVAIPATAATETAFERGLARFQAGAYRDAIDQLTVARLTDPADRETALLLGIAYYQLGELARAAPLLTEAAASEDPDTRDSARIFLGLIAERAGEEDTARDYYGAVARSSVPELTASAHQLLDRGTAAAWSMLAVLRPELDSNVPLQPSTVAVAGMTRRADADLFLLVRAWARPIDGVPIVLDETASYRKQEQLTAFDMLASSTGAMVTLHGIGSLAYHFEASTLGGAQYELGHLIEGRVATGIAPRVTGAIDYAFAVRDYAAADYAGYSGTYHRGEAKLEWRPGGAVEIGAGALVGREQTADATLATAAYGATAGVAIEPSEHAMVRFDAVIADRPYDASRDDLLMRCDASLYVEIAAHLGAVLGGSIVRNRSSSADFDYTKWTSFLGLVVAR